MLSDDEPLLEKTKSFGSIGQNKYLIEENVCLFSSYVEDEKNKSMPLCCLSDPVWDLLDPLPDIRLLFSSFDSQFFGSSLGSVEVKWSSRMTLCAGVCKFQRRHGICSISLSEPLLKFRPRKDLVETLLHEMIHAFLFVTRRDKDRDDHGPNFKSHMHRINSLAGLNITEPKRNVPLKRKTTFESHFKDQAKSKKQVKSGDIRNFITINSQNKNCISESASQPSTSRSSYSSIHIWPSDDKGHILGNRHQDITSTEYRPNIIETVDLSEVSCPNCACIVLLSQINEHLDICLS
ncbi:SprT-like domain-containing protein Spartan [Schistosoma japonicum]|nr:SprT-like domain-containing protein Spartan [Schistosoma japonicum]